MDYLEVKLSIDNNETSLDELVEFLTANGFYSFLINDPEGIEKLIENLNETEWYDRYQVESMPEGRPSVTLYFSSDDEGEKEASSLKALFDDWDSISISRSVNSDEGWKDRWKEFYRPTKVSDKVVVSPTWASEDEIDEVSSSEDIVIKIDPGMAFGTGTHETTALAIRLMEKYLKPEMKVLDVGTGSGILAILAARLGAKDVLGIDIDPDAVETAKENTSDYNISIVVGDLTKGVNYTADMVVANLLTNLVIKFTPDAKKHLRDGGIYITSGILKEHQEDVIKNMEAEGFHVIDVLDDGDWIGIAARL